MLVKRHILGGRTNCLAKNLLPCTYWTESNDVTGRETPYKWIILREDSQLWWWSSLSVADKCPSRAFENLTINDVTQSMKSRPSFVTGVIKIKCNTQYYQPVAISCKHIQYFTALFAISTWTIMINSGFVLNVNERIAW